MPQLPHFHPQLLDLGVPRANLASQHAAIADGAAVSNCGGAAAARGVSVGSANRRTSFASRSTCMASCMHCLRMTSTWSSCSLIVEVRLRSNRKASLSSFWRASNLRPHAQATQA